MDVDSQSDGGQLIKRLRRTICQVGGVIRMIEWGRDCARRGDPARHRVPGTGPGRVTDHIATDLRQCTSNSNGTAEGDRIPSSTSSPLPWPDIDPHPPRR